MSIAEWLWWGSLAANLLLLAANGWQLWRILHWSNEQERRWDRMFAALERQTAPEGLSEWDQPSG